MIRTTTQCDEAGYHSLRLVSEYRQDSDHIKFQANCVSGTVSIEDATLDASKQRGPPLAKRLAPSWFMDSCIGFSLNVACTYAEVLMEGGDRLCVVPAFCRKTDAMQIWFIQCVMRLLMLRAKHRTPPQKLDDDGIHNSIHVELAHAVDDTHDVYNLSMTVNDLIHCLPVSLSAPLLYEFAFFRGYSHLICSMCADDDNLIEQVRSVVRTLVVAEFESMKQMALFKMKSGCRAPPLAVTFHPVSRLNSRGVVKTKPVKLQKPLSMKDGCITRRRNGAIL